MDYGVTRTNIVYGGKIPDVKNVIFVNGDIDPWHALSVLQDLNEDSPAILIRGMILLPYMYTFFYAYYHIFLLHSGSSHCQDLQPDDAGDIPELKVAREKIRKIVSGWLRGSHL